MLQAAASATATLALSPSAAARSRTRPDALITIFLRGGFDSLSAIVPHGEHGRLRQLRPTLLVPPPGSASRTTDIDGLFGLSWAAHPLSTPLQAGELLVVHATGSTDPTRSHFAARHKLATASPLWTGAPLVQGWVARHLESTAWGARGRLRALSLSPDLPTEYLGSPEAIAAFDPSRTKFPGDPARAALRKAMLGEMYDSASDPLRSAAEIAIDAGERLGIVDFAGYVPAPGVAYSQSPFGRALRSMAAILKAGLGLEAMHYDFGGWDTHRQTGPPNAVVLGLIHDLCSGLQQFHLDLDGTSVGYTVAVMSEFGRRVSENGSGGTDHGHGTAMLLMGPRVLGGRVVSDWPGLGPADLDRGDLAITIDYRDILSEVIQRRLHNADLAAVFPGYTPQFRGVVL
jgi:uncharacterized protein (DUF1501 family)